MSTHICSNCGTRSTFSAPAARNKMCKDFNTEFLGALPLDIHIREQTDSGKTHRGGRSRRPQRRDLPQDRAPRRGQNLGAGEGLTSKFPNTLYRTVVCDAIFMTIKSRQMIRRMAAEHQMIAPFEPGQVARGERHKIVSYGTSSYGYDIRCSDDFKIFNQHQLDHRRSEEFDEKSFVDFKGEVCIIPPNSFALARTVE